jgi:hypothetical protein
LIIVSTVSLPANEHPCVAAAGGFFVLEMRGRGKHGLVFRNCGIARMPLPVFQYSALVPGEGRKDLWT